MTEKSALTKESGSDDKTGMADKSEVRDKADLHAKADGIKHLKKYIDMVKSRKAENVVILDVHRLTSYTDHIIIMTGNSARQVSSMADYIYKSMKSIGNAPIGFEGIKGGEWALLDFGDVIIHVFDQKTRALYDIEGLWSDALRIDLSEFDY